jgi:hypothetical protein
MADPAYIDEATGALTDGEAWIGIATETLGSDTATVTFTAQSTEGTHADWSQFVDLVVVLYARGGGSSIWDNGLLRFATGGGSVDTGANYAVQWFGGQRSSDNVWCGNNQSLSYGYIRTLGGGAGANEFACGVVTITDPNSGKWKSVHTQMAASIDGDGFVRMGAVTWKNQGAIDKMTFTPGTGDWQAGSMFSLFGVLPRMVS